MDQYVGLDVSLKDTSVAIREDGKRIWRGKGSSDPHILAQMIRKHAPNAKRVVFETAQIIAYFVPRWQIEVTFAETRAHLGVETQRQWNDKAIMRTTPSPLALYSLVTLWACDLLGRSALPYAAAWYKKTEFTLSDAIGAVRMVLWDQDIYRQCPPDPDIPEIQPSRIKRMTQALCFAA